MNNLAYERREYQIFSDLLQAVESACVRPGSTIETSIDEPELATSDQVDDAVDFLGKYNIRLNRLADRQAGSFWIFRRLESAEERN